MKLSNCIVFFDFDNTIATTDTFDSLLPRFSKNDRWVALEEMWEKGEIGSKECLEGQLECLHLKKEELDDHLSKIRLDPYFKKTVDLLNSKKVKTIILSDNFDYILKRVLNFNSIKSIKIYSNRLKFINGKHIPVFPFRHKSCWACAHCKTKNLFANVDKDATVIYIGDGRTDMCPAKYSHLVFAKESLLKHCRDRNITHIPYRSLKDVYNYFRSILA